MMLMIPPCDWPYCGSKPPVLTWTSSTKAVLMPTPSVPYTREKTPRPPNEESVMFTPSAT